jgi:outer membrane protein
VVDKQAVPYVRSDLDLTDRVIQSYNQGGGGAGDAKPDTKAPAPKATAPTLPGPLVPTLPKP